jgi:tetratricopeptide (TPR) repeat protein
MLGRAYGARAEHASWYQAMGFAKKARAAFEAAVAADPKDVTAHRDLGDYYIDAPSMLGGGKDKALQQASLLDALSPSDADYLRARVAENSGDKTRAEQLYKSSVSKTKQPAAALSELAGFYRRSQRYDDMQATIDRIAALERPGVALYDGASMLVRTGRNLPAAIKMLNRYIDEGTSDEEPIYRALYQLGLAYQKSGDAGSAQAKLHKAVEIADFAPAKKALKDLAR